MNMHKCPNPNNFTINLMFNKNQGGKQYKKLVSIKGKASL